MQFSISKTKIAAIIVTILMLTSITMMALPSQAQEAGEQAHGGTPGVSPWGPLPAGVTPDVTVIDYAYLSASPSPIGVGQDLLVNIWTTPSASDSVFASNYKVTITLPDNTTDTRTMNSYYADRTAWFQYVPELVGIYKFTMDYPGDYYPAGTYGVGVQGSAPTNVTLSRWYMPCSTPYVTNVTVQSEMISSWPPAALPFNEYWTRPVNYMNREWWPILGNYPYSGSGEGWPNWPADTNYYSGTQASSYRYQPLVTGPNTCHIVWRRQDQLSGLIGGPAGIEALSTTASVPGLIYAGRCYQTQTLQLDNGTWASCATCYDLRTGKMYYATPTTGPNPGVTPTLISYTKATSGEVPGAESALGWTISLMAFSGNFMYKINPLTGQVTSNITTIGAGKFIDPFMINIQTNNTATGPRWINWTTAGTSTNFTSRVMDNRTYNSTSLGNNIDWQGGVFGSITTINPSPQAPTGIRVLGYSLQTGLLISNFTDTYVPYQTGCTSVDHGKIACLMQDGIVVAYDLQKGTRAWISQQTYSAGENGGWPWGIWGSYSSASYGGNYLVFLYDGIYAFNWDTGKISWVYKAPSVAFETPYSGWTPFDTFSAGALIADGKMYDTNAEHTPSEPYNRNYRLHCINMTNGEGIWNISTPTVWNGGTSFTCADGYLTVGAQDGYMYVLGRGISATTVSAPQTTVAQGTPVLIQGTVLDQSPGNPGVACVADGSQATYMEYLYMQQPLDGIFHNVTILGVPVSLLAIDNNGTVIDIGTTTSDVSGNFQMAWTPPNEGVYKITANFAGSESYGTSWAETGLSVGPAPEPYPTPVQPEAPVDYTMTITYAAIAIIIAVVIAVAVAVLLLRKRS